MLKSVSALVTHAGPFELGLIVCLMAIAAIGLL